MWGDLIIIRSFLPSCLFLFCCPFTRALLSTLWLTSTHAYKTFVLVTHQYSRLQNIRSGDSPVLTVTNIRSGDSPVLMVTKHSFWWLPSTHGYKTFVLVTHQYSRLQNIPVRVSYSFCNIVQSERCILVKGFLSKATKLIFKSYMTVNPDKYTYVELVLPSCMSFDSSTFSTFSTNTFDLFN
jgi:hypothetical protein